MTDKYWGNICVCVLVTIDGVWIGWLDLLHLIHSCNSGLQAIYRAIAILHTSQLTLDTYKESRSSLVVSWQQIYQSHCNFKLHMKSSWHSLIHSLSFLLNHYLLPSPEPDPVLSTTVLYFIILSLYPRSDLLCPFITPRLVPYGKYSLWVFKDRVYWSIP
jgi:hypothetical protein